MRLSAPAILTLALLTMSWMAEAEYTKRLLVSVRVETKTTDSGDLVLITGKVTDEAKSPISNALVSIQVNNPYGTSIYIAAVYTAKDGTYSDSFSLAKDAPRGNYTIFVTADKPGYARGSWKHTFTLAPPPAVNPDFSIEISPRSSTVKQGELANYTITVISQGNFSSPVELDLIGQPEGVTHRFSSNPVIPKANVTHVTLTLTTSSSTPTGPHNITVIAFTGNIVRRGLFMLTVLEGPELERPVPIYVLLTMASITLAATAVAIFILIRWRRKVRAAIPVERLVKEADKGYLAAARALARLEELRALGEIDEETYRRVWKEIESKLK